MKKFILFYSLLTLLVACDAPQRTRLTKVGETNSLSSNPGTGSGSSGSSWTSSGSTTGSSSGANSTLPAGFTSCDITPKYFPANNNGSTIGYIGVCQSTLDETLLAVKPSLTDTVTRTCLIPTYKAADGSSTYIGQPQCTYTTQNVVTQGQLPKNRNGYANTPLNGLMVMKETSLTAYFKCMDAYASYVSSACPYGANTNATCATYARNYMTTLCNDFKAMHTYIDIKLK